jgi:GTP-binding protein
MGNIVAIVGRPNVGKSTLFNRLVESRQAIVDEEAGTTRDRHYGFAQWNGCEFSVIDTGGWVEGSDDVFEEAINRQVQLALDEADVILFLVDVAHGVTDLDQELASRLRRLNKQRPVLLVANKADNYEIGMNAAEFYKLGLGDPITVSAVNGSGTGDLLDLLVEKFDKTSPVERELEDLPRFAVVGRPNAGKSSLINSFIGEERHIVTDIAGTTRDSVYTRFNKFGFDFYLVDTAGIRKKSKVTEDLEYYSVIRSIRSIESADVCILMIDATRGVESQDMNIFSIIQKNKKGLVVCVNKWDLVENKSNETIKTFERAIKERFAPFVDFPVLFISATTRQRIFKVLETAKSLTFYLQFIVYPETHGTVVALAVCPPHQHRRLGHGLGQTEFEQQTAAGGIGKIHKTPTGITGMLGIDFAYINAVLGLNNQVGPDRQHAKQQ